MVGMVGNSQPIRTLANTIQGYTPPQMTAFTNPQVMDYAKGVGQSAQQNLQTQISDLNKALVMGDKGVEIGDKIALTRLLDQIPGLMGAVAYHGTPHTIRGKFDISKVGTGEGAQAYGHGMYFAESPAVARNYMEFEGLPSLESKVPLQRQTRDFLNEYVDPNSKPSDWLKGAKEDAKANNRLDVLAELNKLKSKDIGHTPIGGNLYKVDIPDADIPLMLDWDKPLSKDAPQQLKDALNGIIKEYPDLKEPFMKAFRENKPGNHYYSLLNDYAKTGDLVKNQQFASSVLQKAGIPGIRYLDEGSRAKGKGTSNFVVFEPSKVEILEQNSKPVTRKELIEKQVKALKE